QELRDLVIHGSTQMYAGTRGGSRGCVRDINLAHEKQSSSISMDDLAFGGHQIEVIVPPMPLRIVLGEAIVDIGAAGPVSRFVLAQHGAVFQRALAADHTACRATLMRPHIGIVLLDG